MGNPDIMRAKAFGVPYESGLTRLVVLNRSGWRCEMPFCLYGDRIIDPNVPGHIDGRVPEHRGTIDHIHPLAEPGSPGHVSSNVRAAHRLCNREKYSRSKRPPLIGLEEIGRLIVQDPGFPAPVVQSSSRGLWDRNDVKAWRKRVLPQ